jgi:hypothetical protein
MSWMQAAGWGLAGGLAAGLLALMTAVSAAGFKWPWGAKEFGPRLFVVFGGLVLGALVAAAAHAQISGGWPAFVIGAGAPATIRGLLSGIEVHPRELPPPGPQHDTRALPERSDQ